MDIITTVAIIALSCIATTSVVVAVRYWRLARRYARLLRRDPLTGLLTRVGWTDEAHALIRSAADQTVSVALIDVDEFKQVNDTRGHAGGDAALIEIADKLRDAIGAHGHAGRIGGDEFVAICPGKFEGLEQLTCGDVTCSVGVVTAAALNSYQLTEMLGQADEAMYSAKQRGRAQLATINMG